MGKIAVSITGLGYVGLPVAIAFSKKKYDVIGFDINDDRVNNLLNYQDHTNEVTENELKKSNIIFTSDFRDLRKASFHIITVPTPIDEFNNPDLSLVESACEQIGKVLNKGDIIVIESTVYPGVTEDIAVPIIERFSKLTLNKDFSIGYSPERINPSDKKHKFENIKKIVSASNQKTLEIIAKVYGSVIKAGIHKAPSIKVAEAAKVIENTQRDLNIAFMNELVKIFNSININTNDVLEAAETKWNFLPFKPGFVGGHCIGVDPYYLISKSQQSGYIPDLLISARKINDGMSAYIAQRILKFLNEKKLNVNKSNILLLGASFKENCPDIRNSKIFDLFDELISFNINVDVFDPVISFSEVKKNYNLNLISNPKKGKYDLIVIAVPHKSFKELGLENIRLWCNKNGSILDLKNTFPTNSVDYTI